MKTSRTLLYLIIALICINIWLTLTAKAEFTVVKVLDGDTIICRIEGVDIKIRLAGIDSQETAKYYKSGKLRKAGQEFGEISHLFLGGRVFGKKVSLKQHGFDKYGRSLCEVFLKGVNINLEMLEKGFAEIYKGRHPKGLKKYDYVIHEARAKLRLRGIWGQKNYVSPSVFRRIKR